MAARRAWLVIDRVHRQVIPHDVIVVGAGYAGMTAARDLTDRGKTVLILEARSRVGGRTHSRPFEGHEDLTIEVGGQWISLNLNHNLRKEIERYSIPVEPAGGRLADAYFVNEGTRKHGLPIPVSEFEAFERALVHTANGAMRINPLVPLHHQPLGDLDVTPRDFYAPLRLPPATAEFISTLYRGYAGGNPDSFSMLHLLAWVAGCAGSPYLAFIAVLDVVFKNGTRELLDTMAESAPIDMALSSPVTEVAQDAKHVAVRTADGTRHRAAACILAVPINTLKNIELSPILSESKARAAKHETAGRGMKQFIIAENVPDGFFAVGSTRLPLILEHKALSPGRACLVGIGDDPDMDPTDTAQVEAALREYLPDARVVAADGHNWAPDPYSLSTAWVSPPGQALRFTSIMSEPEGRLIFAGSDVAQHVFWGWIEGAVHSGHEAAHRAIGLL